MTDTVAEKAHAVLSPSGWLRWSACPGSVELERPFPNRSSKYARYGTAAHEIAERCLTQRVDAEHFLDTELTVEGEVIRVDQAMADMVNEFVSYVHTFLDPAAGDIIMPEQRVPLMQLTGERGAEGTSDVVGVRKVEGGYELVSIDFKTGQGVPVYAKDNGQLRMYALGALAKFGAIYDFVSYRGVIIQPPLKIVDDETMPIRDLLAFGDEVAIAAGRTQVGNAELVPGEKQCKFCRAKSTCPALRDEVLATVTVSTPSSFRDLDKNPDAMPKTVSSQIRVADDGTLLAAQMRSLKLVEDWCKSVRAEVERRLMSGDKVPGFKVVQGKAGNRQWGDEDRALELLKKVPGLKIDDVAPRKLVTAPAAEKLMRGKEKHWAKLAPLITQSPGGPSVAPESDPRPEYAVVSTATSFAALPAAQESASASSPAALSPETLALFD